REDAAPVGRGTVRTPTRLCAVENLEAGQHPGAFLTAGAEGPATGDPVAPLDGYGPPPSLHGGAGDGDVGPVAVDLLDALVRQPERDELGDVVVAEIPADGAGALGQQLHDAQIGPQVGRQEALFRDLPHWAAMFRWRTGGVKRYCRVSRARRLR